MIRCNDAGVIAAEATKAGYTATVVSSSVITLRASDSYIDSLRRDARVATIQKPRRGWPMMEKARVDVGADRLHSGEDLETPFTGKGVVIGVIDQGFEYRHIAFLDDNNQPRTKWLWNRTGYSQGIVTEPTDNIPSNGDLLNTVGHATHVTNIAAGSHIPENDYYGIAPEADIIMIPSEFVDAEVIEDVRFVADYAASEHKPWVVNMSFGTQMGAHDGTSVAEKAIDEILSEGNGRAICVAAGNDRLAPMHAMHVFTEDKDTVCLLIDTGGYGAMASIYGQTADGQSHITGRPFLYTPNGEKDFKDHSYWTNYYDVSIDEGSQKECHLVGMPRNALTGGNRLGIELTADEGTAFHAWVNIGYGSFANAPDDGFISGDSQYTVSGMTASAEKTIVVGSYNTRDTYDNINGITISDNFGRVGEVSAFSNEGPLVNGLQKPQISAPGSTIISAISKYSSGFNRDDVSTVQDVKRGVRHFYYSAMYGTSMATPMVTGTIALWLQAYPRMSNEQLLNIIQTTSRKDEFTGDESWTPLYGYGKIDAYEGLKAALQLAADDPVATAINPLEENCNARPVTISKQPGMWRLLFNKPEPWAEISVTTLDGTILYHKRMQQPRQGQEVVLSWQLMLPSVHQRVCLLRIATPQANIVRKVTL